MNVGIDYRKISDSILFYQDKGFEYLEVPWIVSKKANDITRPKEKKRISNFLGEQVGSGEQSFLEMILDKKLGEGKYVCCTPCFRDDKLDELHQKYFMKVELIDFLGYDNFEDILEKQNYVLDIAREFFEKYLPVKVIEFGNQKDIVSLDGIELGSYGVRNYGDFSWIYGTGIAEPRLSYVLSKISKGYHVDDIPRGRTGDFSKIYEEVLELYDAKKQGIKLMELMELSDLIGAVESYLNKKYSGAINFEDLIKMGNVTKRAFENGRR